MTRDWANSHPGLPVTLFTRVVPASVPRIAWFGSFVSLLRVWRQVPSYALGPEQASRKEAKLGDRSRNREHPKAKEMAKKEG